MTKVKFLGASGTVTGSKYLVEHKDKKILVDAGLFQGSRQWREKNWVSPDFPLNEIDAVLITHAHIDHTGILPRFKRLGLKCPVYCTSATSALMKIMLPDSGHLQEEEAEFRNKKGKSRHKPALPLYTEQEAMDTLTLLREVPYAKEIKILDGITATWNQMGHILGAASISLKCGSKKITFSGDIGRYDVPILVDPKPLELGDLLLIESTYGNREHQDSNPKAKIAEVINRTYEKGGALVVPSFAVGRAQLLLYYLRELKAEGAIPNLPVVVDSPMACDATDLYKKHFADYDCEALEILKEGGKPFSFEKLVMIRDRKASMSLNSIDEPMVIISASGMLSGGRILHHLLHKISDPKNTVLFVGYQPEGGRGDWLQKGNKTLRLFGEEIPVNADIETISGMSAHAGKSELLRWARESDSISKEGKPGRVAVVHGEQEAAKEFAQTLNQDLSFNTFVAQHEQVVEV